MTRRCALLTVLAATAGTSCSEKRSGPALPVHGPAIVSGNYRLQICREGCGAADASRAYIVGTLVLADTEIRSRQEKYLFYFVPADTLIRTPLAANGCFQLDRITEHVLSYAGIIRGARILWRRISGTDTLEFPLFRSPDAGYTVKLVQFGDTLKGTGHSWGAGSAYIDAPDDAILATRIGEADARVCHDRG